MLIDEFQRVPSILLAIKDIVDNAAYSGEDPSGMPKLVSDPSIERELYYSSYMNTYIERDVSALEQVGKLDEFRSLVTYLAANTAQELKYDRISKEIGVSAPTVKSWVTILERSGIIYILRPLLWEKF